MLMYVMAHKDCINTVRGSALKVDPGRKFPHCTKDWAAKHLNNIVQLLRNNLYSVIPHRKPEKCPPCLAHKLKHSSRAEVG